MVFPGTSIELRLRAVADAGGGSRVAFTVRNAAGEDAIAGGFAQISAPD
jgi:hypothetical protein